MVKFIEVDENNWRCKINVKKEQEKYVANHTITLARAFAYRNKNAKAYYVVAEKNIVGVILYHDGEDECYIISELLIDEKYQGHGYGKESVKIALENMRKDGRYKKVNLCYIEGNDAAKNLYEKFGFKESYKDDEEIIMELYL